MNIKPHIYLVRYPTIRHSFLRVSGMPPKPRSTEMYDAWSKAHAFCCDWNLRNNDKLDWSKPLVDRWTNRGAK